MAAGCGSAATTPATSATASVVVSTAVPASVAPPSAAPPSSAPEATAAPSAIGLEDWTAAQLFLLAGAEPNIRPTCGKAPRLPDGAYDGIQCEPDGFSIGYYAFDERDVMRKLYFDRLAEYGVEPDSGEGCFDGKPGESVDTPGNEGFELHVGCYVDETGLANARMIFASETWGQSVYVGVVGNDGSIDNLFAALFPDYEPGSTGCGWCAGQIWSAPGEFH